MQKLSKDIPVVLKDVPAANCTFSANILLNILCCPFANQSTLNTLILFQRENLSVKLIEFSSTADRNKVDTSSTLSSSLRYCQCFKEKFHCGGCQK